MKNFLLLIYIFGLSMNVFAQDNEDAGIKGHIESFQGLIGVYNDQMQGKKTASGESYSPELLTAAHKDLPFGTQLRVTNFANGRSVVVKVNDRGTKNRGRVLEVSKRAATMLDFLKEGVAYVKVDVLSTTSTDNDANTDKQDEDSIDADMNNDRMSAQINKEPKILKNPNPNDNNNTQEKDTEQPLDGAELDTKAVSKFNPEPVAINPENEKLNVNRIFIIQFGAFSTQKRAQDFQKKLAAKDIKTYYAKEGKSGSELYKVREEKIYRDLQEVFARVLEYKKQGIDCFAVGKFFVDDKKKK